jgi:TPR repeat protein
VNTKEGAKRVFSALGQNDARALCFMWWCSGDEDLTALCRSAELGFAWAQALLAEQTPGGRGFKLAQLAAAQGERDGLFQVGFCFRHGDGCGKNWKLAKENFLLASELGDVSALVALGHLLDESDPQRWRWWGLAAVLGQWISFLSNFAKQVGLFNSGRGSAVVMFAIGQALQGHVNEEARSIFKSDDNFDSLIGPAKQAIAFYKEQIKATKDAMRAWTLVGTKLKVVKDVRKLIAKLIWDSRDAALYKT